MVFAWWVGVLVTRGAFGCVLFGLGLGLRFSEWFWLGFLVRLVLSGLV